MTHKNRTTEDTRPRADETTPDAASAQAEFGVPHDRASQMLCSALDAAFAAASHHRKVTNAQAGNACGVSEKLMRFARGEDGGKPLSAVREMFLPRTLFYAYQRAKADAYERLHGAALSGTDTTQAHVLMGTMLSALKCLHETMADGRIEDHEIGALLRELDEAEEQGRKLRRLLHARVFPTTGDR
jgi:hypothetical protein